MKPKTKCGASPLGSARAPIGRPCENSGKYMWGGRCHVHRPRTDEDRSAAKAARLRKYAAEAWRDQLDVLNGELALASRAVVSAVLTDQLSDTLTAALKDADRAVTAWTKGEKT